MKKSDGTEKQPAPAETSATKMPSAEKKQPATAETAAAKQPAAVAIIALGSNMGDREMYLRRAWEEIEGRAGHITKASSIMETEAYGYTDQDNFLNMVLEIETGLSPHRLLAELLTIEAELGRVRTIHWGPRTIDLDIIYYGEQIIDDDDLRVPHPDLHNREFVLRPIAEIEPEWYDPKRQKTVGQMLDELI